MNTLPPEFAPNPSSLEARFNHLIDVKFAQGQPHPGWREHEEELRVVATRPLSLCPTASDFRLERPIPAEAELARAKWEQFGGYLVKVIEVSHTPMATSSLESYFFAIGDTMYWRKTHNSGPAQVGPGESIMVPPQPLDDTQVSELWEWVETGMVEP